MVAEKTKPTKMVGQSANDQLKLAGFLISLLAQIRPQSAEAMPPTYHLA